MHAMKFKERIANLIAWRIRPAWLASWFKKAIGIKPVRLSLPTGNMIVDPVSHLGMHLVRDGFYEPELTDFLQRSLAPGDTFVDVGANEGYFSVLAGTLIGPTGRLVVVEPQRRLQSKLHANFAANQIQNYDLLPLAISDQVGQALIHLTPDMNSGATGLSKVTRYACETQSVELIPLSELFRRAKLDVVDVMKMDIEGFEYEAILGSKEIFQAHRVRQLAIELHPNLIKKRGLEASKIFEFLSAMGYVHRRCGPADIFSMDNPS
jgi:FkbM family methyltransferase